jgi:hypothetical protein
MGLQENRLFNKFVFSLVTAWSDITKQDNHLTYFRLKWLAHKVLGYQADLMESCLPPEKLQALLSCLQNTMDIPGDIIECGVYRAGNTLLMADALRSSGSAKTIHGFDSFEGMPEALSQDALPTGEIVYQQGVLACTSLAMVREKMKVLGHQDRVIFHKGFFQDTMPGVISADSRFSFVLIDCDQYAGTKFCLELLYDKVNPGGMILIDDYFVPGNHDTPGVKIAVDEFLQGKPEAGRIEHLALSLYGFDKI